MTALSPRTYHGRRNADGDAVVYVTENGVSRRLDLRLDLDNHSPTGFNWGYWGSGPAQLALAILADALDDDDMAQRLHQRFKFRVIGRLNQNKGFEMTRLQVLDAVRAILASSPNYDLTHRDGDDHVA